jgi:hypothetical protein
LGYNVARFGDRGERERYMDSLERQMEHEREQILRTLDRMTEDSDRRRKTLEKLRSALPSFPSRTPMWGAVERERPTEPMGSETPSALEESPRKASEPRSWWQRMFGGS